MTEPLLHRLSDLLDMPLIKTPRWVEHESNASHEAGHAVAAISLGIPITDMTVTKRSGGLVRLARNPTGSSDVLVSLAGPVAESLWLARAGIVGNALVVGCEGDFHDAWRSTPGRGAEHVAQFLELHARAERLTARFHPVVAELAAQLMVKRRLRGEEVCEIVSWHTRFLEPFEGAKRR